jgi:hypothetical protein
MIRKIHIKFLNNLFNNKEKLSPIAIKIITVNNEIKPAIKIDNKVVIFLIKLPDENIILKA